MSNIQRYEPWPQEWPKEDANGDLVMYEDHLKIVKNLEIALDECRQALTDYMDQYPHMAKGYLVDAAQHARAALKLAKAHVK